jgi:hypothetical protein
MSASVITQSLGLFILAGLCEIGGGWLVWQWLREARPWPWGVNGRCDPRSLWGCSDLSTSTLRSRLCHIRWVLYCIISFLGLGLGWQQTRSIRFDRRRREFNWGRYYHVLA